MQSKKEVIQALQVAHEYLRIKIWDGGGFEKKSTSPRHSNVPSRRERERQEGRQGGTSDEKAAAVAVVRGSSHAEACCGRDIACGWWGGEDGRKGGGRGRTCHSQTVSSFGFFNRDLPARLLLLLLLHGRTKAEVLAVMASAPRAARSMEGRSWWDIMLA